MRAVVIAFALLGSVAWAQAPEPTTPPAPTEAAAPDSTPAPAPAVAPAPAQRPVRYVNADGEPLVCKPVSGATGTRLKGRGKLICGTEAEWEDSRSEVNRMFDNMIRSNTPNPRG